LPRQLADQPVAQRAGRRNAELGALEVLWFADLRRGADDKTHTQRLVRKCADRLGGYALGEEAHRGTRAESDIDCARHQALLQFGVAGENHRLHVEAVLRPDTLRRTDLDRREGKWLGHRFADSNLVGRHRRGHGAAEHRRQRKGRNLLPP
jgi:hypothetical protein